MKLILVFFGGCVLAATSVQALSRSDVPSPDGRFAVSMGAYKEQHWDNKANLWVADSDEQPAAIIELPSRKVLLELSGPLKDEDKVVWSSDSKWLAFNHRGNKQSDLSVYFWNGESFEKSTLPELPEPKLTFRPNKKPLAEQVVHFDEDTITPLRWLKSGALLVSRKYGMTDNTVVSVSYSRVYLITIGFDAKRVAFVQNITKQKQKAEVQE